MLPNSANRSLSPILNYLATFLYSFILPWNTSRDSLLSWFSFYPVASSVWPPSWFLSSCSHLNAGDPQGLGRGLFLLYKIKKKKVSMYKIFMIFSTRAFIMLYILATSKLVSLVLASPLLYRLVSPTFYLIATLSCLIGVLIFLHTSVIFLVFPITVTLSQLIIYAKNLGDIFDLFSSYPTSILRL